MHLTIHGRQVPPGEERKEEEEGSEGEACALLWQVNACVASTLPGVNAFVSQLYVSYPWEYPTEMEQIANWMQNNMNSASKPHKSIFHTSYPYWNDKNIYATTLT